MPICPKGVPIWLGFRAFCEHFCSKFQTMDEEVKITEMTVEEPVGEPTARQELETLLNEILPEEKRTGDVDQMALDFIKEQLESNNRIAEAIADDVENVSHQIILDCVCNKSLGSDFVKAEFCFNFEIEYVFKRKRNDRFNKSDNEEKEH